MIRSPNNVFWITGLSGAGKTTLAKVLLEKLKTLKTIPILLDGDILRVVLNRQNAYSKEERLELAYTYGRLAKLLWEQGFTVIVATISMFEEVRMWNRENIANYVEVYLKVSEEERIRRNPKGLYNGQNVGKLVDFKDTTFEEPKNPDFVFESNTASIEEIIEQLINVKRN